MSKLLMSMSLVFIVIMTLLTIGCVASNPTPTSPAPTPSPVPAPAPSPTPAPPTAQLTAGQLAEQGKTVLANFGQCHGDSGQGFRAPALIGPNSQLVKYKNAKELLGYISSTMPADKPGSLTQQQYLQVLCFMLVQNKFVTADTPVDPNQLERLVLNK
jgi:hypothetical protein